MRYNNTGFYRAFNIRNKSVNNDKMFFFLKIKSYWLEAG